MKVIGQKDEYLEQIITRLSLEPSATAISWKVDAALDAENASYFSENLRGGIGESITNMARHPSRDRIRACVSGIEDFTDLELRHLRSCLRCQGVQTVVMKEKAVLPRNKTRPRRSTRPNSKQR
jgi:hypothetical protein